jgi:hypothetical protein
VVLFKNSLKLAKLAALLALAAFVPSTLLANPQAGGSHKIRARVPMACWVQIDAAIVAQTGNTGSIVEACNTPSGFTLTASYRPLGPNERAEFTYGNQQFVLSPSGQQVLRSRADATVRTVPYQFGTVQVEGPLVLSIIIQPI